MLEVWGTGVCGSLDDGAFVVCVCVCVCVCGGGCYSAVHKSSCLLGLAGRSSEKGSNVWRAGSRPLCMTLRSLILGTCCKNMSQLIAQS